nr:vasoactive intestinal polypeptide receptor 2 [Salvelinus alpinus]
MERSRVGLLFLALCLLRVKVSGRNPTCHFLWELQRAELVCHYELKKQSMEPAGCGGLWDNISCWAPAAVGEEVTLSCPPALTHLFGRQGNISRNCTEAGWSDVYPSLSTVCWSSDNKPNMLLFYSVVKTLYTLGHSLSLIALITSTLILCLFRRLHCTRNYIHVNLFVSFILRAVAVLVKDSVIFSHNENTDCSTQPSLVRFPLYIAKCMPMSVSKYCLQYLSPMSVSKDCLQYLSPMSVSNICLQGLSPMSVSNVCLQGLSPMSVSNDYLQCLSPRTVSNVCLQGLSQMSVSKGCRQCLSPMTISNVCLQGLSPMSVSNVCLQCLSPMSVSNICLQCWERNDIPTPWRVINWPIMASVIINFVLFISIIRILVQKLRCSDMGGNDQSQYRRLAKSTLLLIPLFGVNYMVFVYLVETESDGMEEYKILFDLVLGSFQGLMVAILYCFLNTEVQGELKLKWRSVSLKRYMWRDYRLHRGSISHNGTDNSTHFQRNSRAQSILQTETTSL